MPPGASSAGVRPRRCEQDVIVRELMLLTAGRWYGINPQDGNSETLMVWRPRHGSHGDIDTSSTIDPFETYTVQCRRRATDLSALLIDHYKGGHAYDPST